MGPSGPYSHGFLGTGSAGPGSQGAPGRGRGAEGKTDILQLPRPPGEAGREETQAALAFVSVSSHVLGEGRGGGGKVGESPGHSHRWSAELRGAPCAQSGVTAPGSSESGACFKS